MKGSAAFIFSLLMIPFLAPAQDFGYEYYNILDYRSLGVNYSLQEFTPRPSNSLPDSERISFKTNLPFIEFRQLGMRLAVGYQTYAMNGQSRSSFSVYAESSNDFPISGKADRSGFFLPVIISANYVKAESGIFGIKNFDIGSLGIGTGLKYRYFGQNFGIEAYVNGAFHYATEGFSVEYGSSTTYTGELHCIFPEIFLDGIDVGYRYQWQSWNMSNAIFDYQRYYHGAFLGVLF